MNLNEKWIDFPGWAGLYEISTMGRIRSIPRERTLHHGGKRIYAGKILSGAPGSDGYWVVNLRDSSSGRHESFKIHSSVLRAFAGERPNEMEACHGDGDKSNNSLANLRWDTHAGNMGDMVKHGTRVKGEMSPNSKLKMSDVLKIKIASGSHKNIAAEFGVTPECIGGIRRGQSWKHAQAFAAAHDVRLSAPEEQS